MIGSIINHPEPASSLSAWWTASSLEVSHDGRAVDPVLLGDLHDCGSGGSRLDELVNLGRLQPGLFLTRTARSGNALGGGTACGIHRSIIRNIGDP